MLSTISAVQTEGMHSRTENEGRHFPYGLALSGGDSHDHIRYGDLDEILDGVQCFACS